MSVNDNEEIKKIVLSLTNIVDRLSDYLKPMIEGNKNIEKELTDLNRDVAFLFKKFIGTDEELKKIADQIEFIYSDKTYLLKDFSEHFERLESLIKRIEYKPLIRIYKKAQKNHSISDNDNDIIEDFLETYSSNPDILETIGHIFWLVDRDFEETYKIFNRVVKLNDDSSCAWCGKTVFFEGSKNDAIKIIDKALSFKDNRNCITFLMNVAIQLAIYGFIDKSFELLNEAKIINEKDARIYDSEGLIYGDILSKHSDALKLFEKALTIDHKNALYLTHIAVALSILGINDDAEKTYLKALEIDKNSYDTNINLAKFYNKKKDYKNALKYIGIIEKNRKFDVCNVCLKGKILYNLNRIDEANELLTSIFNSDVVKTCDAYYYNYIKTILYEKEKPYIETFILEKYEQIKNRSIFNLTLISELHDKGYIDLISNLFNLINTKDFSTHQQYNLYAWITYKLNKPKLGLSYAKKAIKFEPDKVEYLDTYASLLSQLNEDDKAITFFRKAISNATDISQLNIEEIKNLYYRNDLENEFLEIEKKF